MPYSLHYQGANCMYIYICKIQTYKCPLSYLMLWGLNSIFPLSELLLLLNFCFHLPDILFAQLFIFSFCESLCFRCLLSPQGFCFISQTEAFNRLRKTNILGLKFSNYTYSITFFYYKIRILFSFIF